MNVTYVTYILWRREHGAQEYSKIKEYGAREYSKITPTTMLGGSKKQ